MTAARRIRAGEPAVDVAVPDLAGYDGFMHADGGRQERKKKREE